MGNCNFDCWVTVRTLGLCTSAACPNNSSLRHLAQPGINLASGPVKQKKQQ